jgi:hypothetical protein
MTRAWRIVLMFLLSVALPVQGFAAYSMAGCGPDHHGPALFQAELGHDHEAALSGHGHAHDRAHGATLADAGHDTGHLDHSHGHSAKSGKCSACASCCSATALPSLPVVLDPVALTDHFAPLEPCGVAAFLSEGPERPPRLVLA